MALDACIVVRQIRIISLNHHLDPVGELHASTPTLSEYAVLMSRAENNVVKWGLHMFPNTSLSMLNTSLSMLNWILFMVSDGRSGPEACVQTS